jgi:thiol:disulfide interchange protein
VGFVQQAGADPTKVRWHGIAFMAGVLVSFWILAGTLLALRAGGENLGWGFQLQSPAFLVVLSSLLFLFGLNLFGVFEIGTSLTRVGESVSTTGLAGSFSSGVLATVVATPCTAPYMGSALGFALTQSNIDALLIFSSVGLGMAAPYVILTWNPRLLKFVPKPGAWMETFKQVLGFPMLATVVWLVWVLGVQMGVDAVVSLLAGLLLLGLGAWILGRWGTVMQSIRTRSIANVLALVAFGAGLALALSTATSESAAATSKPAQTTSSLGWEPYSPERVAQLKKAGTPLFIDFTAAWCLSCQVNERVALNTPEVAAAFRAQKIVLLKADWTRRDARITEALAQFGRSGVPLYVLIRRGKTQLLPEVLTPAVVLNALGSAQ